MTNCESSLDMVPDTVWLLEAERRIDSESLCNSSKKQILVRGHYCERYIACLSGKQKAGFKFDSANRECQARRGHKLICREQGFPQQTPKYVEVLQREGANC